MSMNKEPEPAAPAALVPVEYFNQEELNYLGDLVTIDEKLVEVVAIMTDHIDAAARLALQQVVLEKVGFALGLIAKAQEQVNKEEAEKEEEQPNA